MHLSGQVLANALAQQGAGPETCRLQLTHEAREDRHTHDRVVAKLTEPSVNSRAMWVEAQARLPTISNITCATRCKIIDSDGD